MFHFDGSFKRSPIQNLGGSSVETDRQTLIKKAQIERKKREEIRKKEENSLKIQSSFHIRQLIKQKERTSYEDYLKVKGLKNFDDLEFLLKRLLYYYELEDADKLIFICQFIIKNLQELFTILLQSNDELIKLQWRFRIQKLLVLCVRQIFSSSSSIAIPLRIIEIFTSFELIMWNNPVKSNDQTVVIFLKRLFSFLIDKSYFTNVRKMLENKIPENTYDEVTTRPHNEIARMLLEMIERPLKLVKTFSADPTFDSKVLSSFTSEILTKDFSNTISNFIVPSLGSKPDFPFIKLIRFLHDIHTEKLCRNQSIDLTSPENDNHRQIIQEHKHVKFNGFLLYSLLKLDAMFLSDVINQNCLSLYLVVIEAMIGNISRLPKPNQYSGFNFDDDDVVQDLSDSDDDSVDGDEEMQPQCERLILSDIIVMINEQNRVGKIVKNIDGLLYKPEVVHSLCQVAHSLMIYNRSAINEYRLLDMLAFKPEFIRTLWYTLLTTKTQKNQVLISILSKGIQIPPSESSFVVPILATFCALFGRLLSTLHDGEFFYCTFEANESMGIDCDIEPIENKVMPFHIKDIIHMSLALKEIAIGLVELAFPETRSALKDHYRNIFNDSDDTVNRMNQEKIIWSQLLKVCVSLLRQLHTRDLRCNFCPSDNWIAPTLNIPLDRPNDLHFSSRRRGPKPFQPIRDFTRKNLEEGPPMSTKQIRSITILKEIPFVVPFNKRFEVLQGLLAAEKLRSQGEMQGFLQGPQTHLTVRRTHLYEDAFDKLSPENEPSLRTRFRVQMINEHQLEEAGIDGGGIFREFLSELIKSAFDPNRGFFILTKDNMLYPNPSASVIQENYQRHYYFIGRMLGKALFENLLVELPLAEFFLSKLAGRQSNIIDIHQLTSLDPDMHKNLMKLKSYDENDFKDLGLDFTVVCDDLGDTRVVELKPDGANITVNSSNWIEYIQMMADFKLNRQIREQCQAFRQGLTNVLPISWLYMFNTKELQVLISGAEIPVDVDDLMNHTRYGGDYNSDHKTVKMFWKVVRTFDDDQRRQLLKFVTSCSRPPLLGFKDLDPPFSIQNSGDDLNRLVTASTCLNLLKLPEYTDESQLREKLLYAIQSGVGFELS
ncbi:CLUMA_CG008399, isoform A [Clunio marinus]|uniref:Ubiquitin-protein ligase E3C n=1 Tax=Clunio marinus TaxID=568069 RepID=A0A1J1I3Y3_9DIPT|nr:CLUMA_CG008399, isoform A [Clunio marinus]